METNMGLSETSHPGFFSIRDYENCKYAAKSLVKSGSVVVLVAPRKELLTHYASLITATLVKEACPGRSLNALKLQSNRELILDSINGRLNQKAWEKVCDSQPIYSEEIWLAENLNKASVSDIIFSAKTMKKLPGAGISLLVLADLENSRGLKELMHGVKVERFDFLLPETQQIGEAIAAAPQQIDRAVMIELAKSIGVLPSPESKNHKKKNNTVSPRFTRKGRDVFMSDDDLRALIRREKKKKSASSQLAFRVKDDFSGNPKSNLLSKKIGVYLGLALCVGALSFFLLDLKRPILENGVDSTSLENRPALLEQPGLISTEDKPLLGDQKHEIEVASSSNLKIQPEQEVDPVEDEESLMLLFDQDYASGAVSLEKSSSSLTGLATRSEGIRKLTGEPSKAVYLKRDEEVISEDYYVQHAAFRNLEGAMIWKTQRLGRLSVDIFTKGNKPQRFVLLSGPFKERSSAQKMIDKNSDAFLVKGSSISRPVISVSGL
ncbi:MAG: hypothetical protein CMF52_08585 [Legionellales bacterium]|nr:hypothetical protein [Legionellales bacterium]